MNVGPKSGVQYERGIRNSRSSNPESGVVESGVRSPEFIALTRSPDFLNAESGVRESVPGVRSPEFQSEVGVYLSATIPNLTFRCHSGFVPAERIR